MKKQEWIIQNLDFYHITPTRNVESIIQNGIEKRNHKGICVVRSKDPLIVRYICETMLNNEGDIEFTIFRISPNEIGLSTNEIKDDSVEEVTNPLHNYIDRENIKVTRESVVGSFEANHLGIENLLEYENQITKKYNLSFLQK